MRSFCVAVFSTFVLVSVAVLCSNVQQVLAASHDQAEKDISECVFRYQINLHPDKMYFLTYKGDKGKILGAPMIDEPFLQRFSNLKGASVLPDSQLTFKGGMCADKKTGENGLHFWIDRISWVNENLVHVEGGGQNSMKGGDAGTFTVSSQGKGWVVKDYKVRIEI